MKSLCALCCAILPFVATPAFAQDTGLKRVAFTEAPADDMQYSLMGEFVGPIKKGDGYEPLGIQLRPVGDTKIEAIQYEGGLPGQSSYTGNSTQLIGHRSGDLVVLSGGPWAIFVEKDKCLIIDREGNKVGQLDRIQRSSPSMGAKPPEGATVLFDGTNTDQFTGGRMTGDGLLMEGADVIPMFRDFNLHVEFRLPYMPNSLDQKRGNSGCYLQSRYEVQVLDSFATPPVFNGCSALYRQKAPDLNMCYPPLQWQTYDIKFTAARWAADGTKLRNARITVWQNGVKTHDDVEVKAKTGAGKPEAPTQLPIRFQNHSDPVRYRNIWIVDRGLASGEFPVEGSADETQAEEPAKETSVDEPADEPPADKESAEGQPEDGGDESAAATEPAESTEAKSDQAANEVPPSPKAKESKKA